MCSFMLRGRRNRCNLNKAMPTHGILLGRVVSVIRNMVQACEQSREQSQEHTTICMRKNRHHTSFHHNSPRLALFND
jgi:hypothetical protein